MTLPYHILFAEIIPLKLWKTFKATDSFFFKVNAMRNLQEEVIQSRVNTTPVLKDL